MKKPGYVLDSFALLAYFKAEPGSAEVSGGQGFSEEGLGNTQISYLK